VLERLEAEAMPGVAASRSVRRRSLSMPAGENSSGSSYAASTTSLEPNVRAIRR